MDLSFLGLMAYARKHKITKLEDLMAATRCGTGCGSCRPYLEELLRSGRLIVGDRFIKLPEVDAPLHSRRYEPPPPPPPPAKRRGPS